LSIVIPSRRRWDETPPFSARPATPVSETKPPAVASPNGCVSRSTSAQLAPPCTVTLRRERSTRTPRICDRSTTMPRSATAVPATLWPPPRTASSSRRSRANCTAAATSDVPAQRTISAGRLSIMPFQTRRARSYSGWPSVSTSPSSRAASSTTASEAAPYVVVVSLVVMSILLACVI
jgi:hypothetical protein